MSRLSINIEADSPAELITSLRSLLAAAEAAEGPPLGLSKEPTPAESPPPAATGTPPPGVDAPGKARRGRKKKAAESSAVTAKPTAAPATADDMDGMFPDAAADTDDNDADADEPVTRDMLRAIGNEFMGSVSMEATVAILKSYGAMRISDVPETQWPDLYRDFKEGLDKARAA